MNGDKTVRLIAAARFYHGGRLLHTGDEFYTDERDAADLVAVSFARRPPVAQLLKPRIAAEPLVTAVIEPEAQTEHLQDAAAPVADEPKRALRSSRYARRDMRAKT